MARPSAVLGNTAMRLHLFVLAMALVLFSTYPGAAQTRALVIGSISNDPVDEVAEWHPFAKYLAAQLTTAGISEGRIIVARDESQMAELLRRGAVDLYIDSPIVSLLVAATAGNKPLLRRWKRGKASYASVIFARADSDLSSPADLRGRKIAFQNTYSTTSYQLPRLALRRAGLSLVPIARMASPVLQESVGFVFSDKDENTLAWVLRGHVDAGATGTDNFEKWNAKGGLRVIWRSMEIPRQIVSYRSDLKPSLVAEIKKSLLSMHTSEEGRAILRDFEGTSRFDEIPPEQLATLRQLTNDIEQIAHDIRR